MVGKAEEMEFRLIDTKVKQKEIEEDFRDLFQEAFEKPISPRQWRHYYLDCPLGPTVSFVYYKDGIMTAHGGLIPQQLVSSDGKRVDYFLQTAIMVRKKYQTLLLFKDLLDTMGEYVVNRKSFAVAFPNHNTYLPFVKMLGWRMVREYMIEQYEVKAGVSAQSEVGAEAAAASFTYELYRDGSFMKWRSALNAAKTIISAGQEITYKEYEGNLEILDLNVTKDGSQVDMSGLMTRLKYDRVNIAGCFRSRVSLKNLILKGTVGIPQRMCFYPARKDQCVYEQIKPSLLISDVF